MVLETSDDVVAARKGISARYSGIQKDNSPSVSIRQVQIRRAMVFSRTLEKRWAEFAGIGLA